MATGRPPKKIGAATGKRTKEVIAQREQAEKELSTNTPMRKWKETGKNKKASAYFTKMKRAFAKIGMDDEMYEAMLNRYCILLGECLEIEERMQEAQARIEQIEAMKADMEFADYIKLSIEAEKARASLDRIIDAKRSMLLSIENNNLMSVLSKLRAVPKEVKKVEEVDPMESILGDVVNINAARKRRSG